MTSDPVIILAPLRGLAGWVARSGAEACVIAAMVLLAQRLLRGRISARWSYNLWLLVLLRLLLPALPASRVSPFNLLPRLGPAKQAAVLVDQNRAGAVAATATPVAEQPVPETSRPLPDLSIGPVAPPVTEPLPDAPIASGVRRFIEPDTSPGDSGFPARASDDDRAIETFDTRIQQPPTEHSAPVAQPSPHQVFPPRSPPRAFASHPTPQPTPPAHRWPAVPDILASLWLLGVILMLARLAWATLRLSRAVRRLRPVTTPDVLDLLDDCRATLNLRGRPGLLLGDGASGCGPALVGLWRPRIVLPADVLQRLTRNELRMVLLHELAHLKRRDLAVNWLLGLIQAVHWFNPLLWLVFRRVRADREVACDELVLAAASDQRRSYAPTILKLLEMLCECADRPTRRRAFRSGPAGTLPLAGMVGVLEPVGGSGGRPELRQLQRRITMIARYDRHCTAARRWVVAGAAVSLVLGGVALTGAVRADENAAPPAAPAAAAAAAQAKPDQPARVDPTAAPAVPSAPAAEAARAVEAAPAKPAAASSSSVAADVNADPTAARSATSSAAADVNIPADPFAARGKEMAELQAKIDARLRELKEHPDRGSKKEVDLLQSMQKMTRAGAAYAEARHQYIQAAADPRGVGNFGRMATGTAAAAADPAGGSGGSSNPFGRANGSAAVAQSHRVGERAGVAAPADVIGIVEDQEAQQADERTAAKLRKKVSPQLDGVSLRDALTFIIGQTGAELFTDWRSLEQISTVPISVAATDIPAEQALDLVLRAAGGDRIGFAIDRGIVVVADRDRIDRMVVTRVYDVADLRARGDLDDMIRTAVAPSSWIKVKPDASRVGAIQEFGDKLVITQTEPNHRQIVRLLALLREPPRAGGQPSGQDTSRGAGNNLDAGAAKYGDMPWRDVPPPLRERAQKLWKEKYKDLIYVQQDKEGKVVELNRREIERQFLDAVRAMEMERSSGKSDQPRAGATDAAADEATSGRDTPALRGR